MDPCWVGWWLGGLGIFHPPDSMDRPHLIFSISHRLYLLAIRTSTWNPSLINVNTTTTQWKPSSILEIHGSIHGHCKCRRHNRLPFLAALAAAFYYFVMPSLLEPGGRSKMSQARAKTSDGEARRMKASSLVTTRRNQSAHPIVSRSCHVHCSIHPHKSLASSSRMLGFAWL